MRIMLVPHSYFPNVGGVEIAVFHLAKELLKQGHQVIIVTKGEHYFKKSVRYPLYQVQDGIEIYRCDFVYPHLSSGVKPMIHFFLSFPITLFRFIFIVRHFQPDIINVQFLWTQAFYCLLAKLIYPCALVVTAHGPKDVFDFSGQPKPRLWRLLRRKVLKYADMLTANSDDLLKKALYIYSKLPNSCCVISNGVSLDGFHRGKIPVTGFKYIFAIGRLVSDKGFDVLIRAFAKIADKWENINLIIGGDGPERKVLHYLIENLNLKKRVQLVGTVLGENKHHLFLGCEFFVLPSRVESFGIVILEAMACEKAIVASKVGGVPEFVKEGKNGILVPPDNSDALAKEMDILLLSPEYCKEIGKANRRLVESSYTWALIAKKYERVYREAASTRNR